MDFKDGRITCIAVEDLNLGDIVEVQDDATVLADGNVDFPRVQKAGTTGRMIGVCVKAAEQADEVTVRLWFAGTMAANVDTTGGAVEAGTPIYIDTATPGQFTTGATNLGPVGLTIGTAAQTVGAPTRMECIVLRADINPAA